jgi:hypothetical protein
MNDILHKLLTTYKFVEAAEWPIMPLLPSCVGDQTAPVQMQPGSHFANDRKINQRRSVNWNVARDIRKISDLRVGDPICNPAKPRQDEK